MALQGLALAPLPFSLTFGSLAFGALGLWAVWGIMEQLSYLVRGSTPGEERSLSLVELGLLGALLLVLVRR